MRKLTVGAYLQLAFTTTRWTIDQEICTHQQLFVFH